MPGSAESIQRIGEGRRMYGISGARQFQAFPGGQLKYEMERRRRNRRGRALRNRARALRESVLGTVVCAVAVHGRGAHSHRAAVIRIAAGTPATQRRREPAGHNRREQSEQREAGDELLHYLALVPRTACPRQGPRVSCSRILTLSSTPAEDRFRRWAHLFVARQDVRFS